MVCQLPEARVHPIDRSVTIGGTLHNFGAAADGRARVLGKRQAHTTGVDGLQLLQ